MADVVDLAARKREQLLVWLCQCGCSTHRLLSNGQAECASCGTMFVTGQEGLWAVELPEPSAPAKEVQPGTKVISIAGSPREAIRVMLQHVDVDQLLAVIAIHENGRVRTWGGIADKDREKWLRRRLYDAYELLRTCITNGL